MVQWLGFTLPVQGAGVQSLVRELDFTRCNEDPAKPNKSLNIFESLSAFHQQPPTEEPREETCCYCSVTVVPNCFVIPWTVSHQAPLSMGFSWQERLAKRDKKAFLSDQCKQIEENNRMGKTRDFFKKIKDTKGTFHAKMGTLKDRNCKDLTEAEDIKKR